LSEVSTDFLNLLAREPGYLIYFLLTLIVCQATFLMVLGQRMRFNDRTIVRYVIATGASLVAWGVVTLGLVAAVVTSQPANTILPPLERAAQMVIVLVIGWAFLTADHERRSRLSNILLLILLWATIIAYAADAVAWSGPNAPLGSYNISPYGLGWAVALLLAAAIGAALTLISIRVIFDAPLKFIFFALIAFGAVGTLAGSLQGVLPGDYSGVLRLAFMSALLITPVILYRMILQRYEQTVVNSMQAQAAAPLVPVEPAVPLSLDPAVVGAPPTERDSGPLMKALGLMLEEADPDSFPRQIVTAACSILKADVGALIKLQDANFADIVYSYNKLLARTIDSIAVSLVSQPTLLNAIERQTQRPLLAERNEDELRDLYARLDIEQRGPTYFQPLVRQGMVIGILMIGMPYTGRELSLSEQEVLKGIGIIAGNLLSVSEAARESRVKAEGRIVQAMVRNVSPDSVTDDEVTAAWEEMQKQLEAAREQIVQLSRNVTELKIELDDERSRMTSQLGDTEEGLSITGRILALTEEQAQLANERDMLAARLRDLEAKLATASASGDSEAFHGMIEVINREKESLQRQRDDLQRQLAELRAAGTMPVPDTLRDVMQRMSADKLMLEEERNHLSARLNEIETQVAALGIEGGASGLGTLVSGLNEQIAELQARYEAMRLERDKPTEEVPAAERASAPEATASDKQLERLRTDLANLAADREALARQRDQLKTEKDDLAQRFDALKEQRARLMAEAAAYQQELTEAHVNQAQIRVQLQRAIDERAELQRLRDVLAAEKLALETERDGLLARVEGDRDRLQQLGQDGIGSLTDMIEDLTRARSALERELSLAQTEAAELHNQLEVARIQSASKPVPVDQDLAQQLARLVQGFRTPIESIVHYTDLMLNESAGILGEMQRKFLRSVASNVRRLWTMTEDLHWMTVLDSGRYELSRTPVDMIEMIEDSITRVSSQLAEKELTIELDLDDELPQIQADSESMQEVVGQLLTNAYLATGVGGAISISARHQRLRLPRGSADATPRDVLVVAVSDAGPGIAPEDQPFVFARRYKHENPLIPGLGDTGFGLAIARSLIEAHGGEIWLETGENGTTMFFALPYELAAVAS
jgi:signal transduction histidine kinase